MRKTLPTPQISESDWRQPEPTTYHCPQEPNRAPLLVNEPINERGWPYRFEKRDWIDLLENFERPSRRDRREMAAEVRDRRREGKCMDTECVCGCTSWGYYYSAGARWKECRQCRRHTTMDGKPLPQRDDPTVQGITPTGAPYAQLRTAPVPAKPAAQPVSPVPAAQPWVHEVLRSTDQSYPSVHESTCRDMALGSWPTTPDRR